MCQMIFFFSLVIQGVCVAVACRTSTATELGQIATLIAESENEMTPLQKAVTKFSIYSSIILGVLAVLVFVIGIAAGYSNLEMFLTSVAIAVSAIPEGLPVSLTVILAVGVERMALIQHQGAGSLALGPELLRMARDGPTLMHAVFAAL